MERQYKNLYYFITKNTIPTKCLPFSKHKNIDSLKQLLEINNSIADVVNSDHQHPFQKRRKSDDHFLHLPKQANNQHPTNRIHHNYTYFSSSQIPKSMSTNLHLDRETQDKHKYSKRQKKRNQIMLPLKKDIYDDHIEKYITTKYESKDIIEKYLANRQQFIEEACKEIEKDINIGFYPKVKLSIDKKGQKKDKSRLPKIQELPSQRLKKSHSNHKNIIYQQQINQIKRTQELQMKQRKRKLRAFKQKMKSLQSKLSQEKTD